MFSEDLDELFDHVDGTAVPGRFAGANISVLFEAPYYAGDGEEVDISTVQPRATIRTIEVPGIKIGSSISIQRNGSGIFTQYRVSDVQPDGTGELVTIYLHEV